MGKEFAPHRVVAPKPSGTGESTLELLAGRPAIDGRVTAYFCENFTCETPAVGVEAIRERTGTSALP